MVIKGFNISLILTWDLTYLQKREFKRKSGRGSFGSCSFRERPNDIPWLKKGLPGGLGIGENYTDLL